MDGADRGLLRAYVRLMDRACSRSLALNLGLHAVTLRCRCCHPICHRIIWNRVAKAGIRQGKGQSQAKTKWLHLTCFLAYTKAYEACHKHYRDKYPKASCDAREQTYDHRHDNTNDAK